MGQQEGKELLWFGSSWDVLCRSHIFWVDRKLPLWAVQVSTGLPGAEQQLLGQPHACLTWVQGIQLRLQCTKATGTGAEP